MKTRSPLLPACLIALALSVSACGEQRADSMAREPARAPAATAPGTYDLATAERALRDGGLDLLRHGRTSALGGDLDPAPRTSQEYTVQDNSQFDLLVFSTPQDAERAESQVSGEKIVKDGGETSRAGNLILVISRGLEGEATYKSAFAIFDKLAGRA